MAILPSVDDYLFAVIIDNALIQYNQNATEYGCNS